MEWLLHFTLTFSQYDLAQPKHSVMLKNASCLSLASFCILGIKKLVGQQIYQTRFFVSFVAMTKEIEQ